MVICTGVHSCSALPLAQPASRVEPAEPDPGMDWRILLLAIRRRDVALRLGFAFWKSGMYWVARQRADVRMSGEGENCCGMYHAISQPWPS